MTSKTSSFIIATLVLSSGVYLPEAFSASNLIQQRSHSTSAGTTARFYAPKDSLDNTNGPKRRRGRPRKTEATAAASANKKRISRRRTTSTATAASASVAETKRRRSGNKRTNPSPKITAKKSFKKIEGAALGFSDSVMNSILDHELLTKEEEIVLGARVRRAAELQATMEAWVEDNRARILQQQEYQRIESVYGEQESLFNSEEEDINSPLLGSASSQAMERFLSEEPEEQLFYQDGTPFNEGEDNAFGMSDYTIFQPQPQQLVPSVPESWMDDILLQHDEGLSVSAILTDEDIRQVLKLQGGRSELRSVLLEGALAREQLIRRNVKLVLSIAKKWVGQISIRKSDTLVRAYTGTVSITGRPTLDEALQEGIMGLAEAAERFDPERGFRFSTYATMWVTNSIRKCFQLESTSGIRLPVPYYDVKSKYVSRVRHYLSSKGEVPSMDVMADEMGVTVERLVTVLRMTQPLVSIDAGLGGASQGAQGAGKSGSSEISDSDYTLASMLPW